ncbi:9091_t:CDS:2 [Paraglomus brasilianum]|uniref:9091_t:CDS:1 n=1 Tax=Paraglomus brasilianum TaxID=144538 RepID=A0A9N8YYT3_9GLOM|nr:9091_t:CDS:2 [Paraglomus brasilianum]
MRLRHLQCTESFYKDSILQEISNRRVSNEEKKKILELLRRVGREDISDDEEEETNANDFVERFRSVDIESASYESIWNNLTDQERTEFEKLVSDRPSVLLQEIHLWKPWWEQSCLNDETVQKPVIIELDESLPVDKDISLPKIMKVTKKLEELTNKPPNPKIIFNLLNKHMESHEFTLILLNDINTLLADVDNVLAALSEIYSIFHILNTTRQTQESKPPVTPHSRKAFLTEKKVYFYFAYVQSLKEKDGAKAFGALRTLIKSEKSVF